MSKKPRKSPTKAKAKRVLFNAIPRTNDAPEVCAEVFLIYKILFVVFGETKLSIQLELRLVKGYCFNLFNFTLCFHFTQVAAVKECPIPPKPPATLEGRRSIGDLRALFREWIKSTNEPTYDDAETVSTFLKEVVDEKDLDLVSPTL